MAGRGRRTSAGGEGADAAAAVAAREGRDDVSNTVVWAANRGTRVTDSDTFDFHENGNAFLQKAGSTVWSTNASGNGVSAIELRDSGNPVLLGKDGTVVWQSFGHPTDTLLSNQDFTQGMRLMSRGFKNLTYTLEIKSGDMILSAGYKTPQPCWSMGKDLRKLKNKNGGHVVSATMVANSWRFYDENGTLLWQFLFWDNSNPNATWIVVLGKDGIISFSSSSGEGSTNASPVKIPSDDACSLPDPCDPYVVCRNGSKCRCLLALTPQPNCGLGLGSPCNHSKASIDLVEAGEGIGCFVLKGNRSSDQNSGFVSYIEVFTGGGTNGGKSQDSGCDEKRLLYVVQFSVSTFFLVLGLICAGFRYSKAKPKLPEAPQETLEEEENFLESLSGMPVRFSYKELQDATNNFSMKLGQGGLGSVYRGYLPDGTRLAVKKLDGIGQGKKEFQAEVRRIGSFRHHHLVRLKGFCEEGTHRLLAYEYMANGSLHKCMRGYLEPEWIINCAISEKSDVYSYGKVLFENSAEEGTTTLRKHRRNPIFPSHAFKMMEEGKLRKMLVPGLEINERDEAVSIPIKVASWCIQKDMNLRPSMFKVVQMREGVCPVPQPLTSSPRGCRFFPSFFKPEDHSDANPLAVQLSGSTVWSTNTSGNGVSAIELRDSGNPVLLGKDGTVVWQSFGHPTDTLLSNQDFTQGMRLMSRGFKNLTYTLEIKSGDMILSAGYKTPQPCWSMGKDLRKLKNKNGGHVVSATMVANSWRFYDENGTLLWQFLFWDNSNPNATWIVVLGKDGIISFSSSSGEGSTNASPVKIPSDDACSLPDPCDPYVVCRNGSKCRCLLALTPQPNCGLGLGSPCNHSKASIDLVEAGEGIGCFVLKGNRSSDQNSGFVSYIEVFTGGGTNGGKSQGNGCDEKRLLNVVQFSVSTFFLVLGQGGLGSVYRGYLPDGTRLAVKKLDGIGQGKKEFRAEVRSIGSFRHHHLVRLKGFCEEGTHRLLAYEYMANGSLHKCMRGYLELEWIISCAISEKSDVYSYGKVLFENSAEEGTTTPRKHRRNPIFPSHAFKMMEEGKLRKMLDPGLEIDERDEAVSIAIKVASWCIQKDKNLRPSMFRVVQMLEGV
ncbi:hypothetical protein NL676_034063 [Syzygium grande]|nr:hypothetical protein NL676_034063 [Syzygium grande]